MGHYCGFLADFLRYCAVIEIDPIAALEDDLVSFFDHMAKERGLLPNSINKRVGVIESFYKFLVAHRYRLALPFALVIKRYSFGMLRGIVSHETTVSDLRRRPNRRVHPKYCVRRDLIEFLKSLPHYRDQLLARIMYATGLRLEEVCNIKLDDLPTDLAGYVEKNRSYRIEVFGKGAKWRTVELPGGILKRIKFYLDVYRPKASKAAELFVSLNKHGTPVTPNGISQAFLAHAKATKLNVTAHKYRHGFAIERLIHWTDYYARQSPRPNDDKKELLPSYRATKRVSIELGHESVTTTEDYLRFMDTYQADINEEHIRFMKQVFEE